jgi:hypothetical protein
MTARWENEHIPNLELGARGAGAIIDRQIVHFESFHPPSQTIILAALSINGTENEF